MSTARIQISFSIAGITSTATVIREEEAVELHGLLLPAGKSGELTTRTDDNTGVLTVESGHGITTADVVTVFWSGGYRAGMEVTATTATTISIDLGAGSILPIATTDVVVSVEVESAMLLTGDDIQVIYFNCANRVVVDVRDDAAASILYRDIASRESWSWIVDTGVTNPFATEDIGQLRSANGGTTEATLYVGILKSAV